MKASISHNKATLIGLTAILLWSTMVGLVRTVTEGLGPVGGAAMVYTVGSILLLFTVGFPRLRDFPRRYLVIGSALFVVYEICLSLSLGYAHSGRQAIEVSIVNYLWPSLTVLFAVLFNGQRAGLLIIPGLLISLLGVCWVQGGDDGFSVSSMVAGVRSNPLSYGLAFAGALIWATYCTVTSRISGGKNGITLFFMLTALALWLHYLAGGSRDEAMQFDLMVTLSLLMAGAALGFGYAAWNVGILHGNLTVLATASYFTPVLSSALASMLLGTSLPVPFWQGAIMVCIGSLLCWWATRMKRSPGD